MCKFYNILYLCVHRLQIMYLNLFSFNTRFYYCNCRFNALRSLNEHLCSYIITSLDKLLID